MKLTRRQLRRLIAEAKFTPRRPLDRDAMQIALGVHSSQLKEKELRNHPFYEKGKARLFGLIATYADPDKYISRYDIQGEHIDYIVTSGTEYIDEIFNWKNRKNGNVDYPITEEHVQLMIEDLLGLNYITLSTNDIVLPTREGRKWSRTI